MASFSTANPPSMKRLSSVGHNEPAQKKPATPLEDKVVASEVKTRLGTVERNRNSPVHEFISFFTLGIETTLNYNITTCQSSGPAC